MANSVNSSLFVFLLFTLASIVSAYDPALLQDFCVASEESGVFVNGKPCKDPSKVTINDFVFRGINIPRDTKNYLNSTVTLVDVDTLPGLNTLGISLGRVDFGIGGLNPPHTHNRASELFICLQGTLSAGFITNNPDHKLYRTTLYAGDMISFPFGLIHFQRNVGNTNAVGFAVLTSQNPGVQHIGEALFRSIPLLDYKDLTTAFQIDPRIVKSAFKKFAKANLTG